MSVTAENVPAFDLRITAVIVLYQRLPAQSEAFLTLQRAYSASATGLSLQILLYDNTPGGQFPGSFDGVEYTAAPQNGGLASAYNWAMERATENCSQWLLTLDQDTDLPENFLCSIGAVAKEVADTPVVAAIVPQIVEGARVLSPYCFQGGAIPIWFQRGFHGIPAEATYAFNSAALVRLSALRQVGGYSPWFWLDNSDAFLFRKLHRYGKRVFVAGDVQVDHNFSMMDIPSRISPQRYRNVLLAESAFWDLEMNIAAGWERTARLLARLVKHSQRKDPPELRHISMEFLKQRLFWSKQRRLQNWGEETRRLFPDLAPFPKGRIHLLPVRNESDRRPKVSVCMAAYNSARYIELQLRSILQQLSPEDEVIVVDDASTDATVEVIRSLNSTAIRLIRHPKNRGVVATFEEALRNATGDILFLADGDDLWADNKVELFLDTFRQNPRADLVISRVAFIDERGAPIEDDMYSNRKSFQSGFWHNLLRNRFQGSAMAIRASLLGSVLPFPTGVEFLHDHWIGMRNARLRGVAVYLDEPLLLYRRHANNLSHRMTWPRQLRARLQSLWTNLIAALSDLV